MRRRDCDLTFCSIFYSTDLRFREGSWESKVFFLSRGIFFEISHAVVTEWRIKGSRSRWEKKGKELNLPHSQFFSKYVPFLKMNNTGILKTEWKTSRNRVEFLPIFLYRGQICYSRITKGRTLISIQTFIWNSQRAMSLGGRLPELYGGFKKHQPRPNGGQFLLIKTISFPLYFSRRKWIFL